MFMLSNLTRYGLIKKNIKVQDSRSSDVDHCGSGRTVETNKAPR